MREEEFREKLRGALGEPPAMAPPSFAGAAVGRPRVYPTAMGALAVALAILLVVVLVGTRGGWTPRGSVAPAATPRSPRPSPVSPSSFPCALPVAVEIETRSPAPPSVSFGFVDVPSGAYHADPTAPAGAITYSAGLKRWVPAPPQAISPDGTQYAYVKTLPAGSELHVVDALTGSDRTVWSSPEDIGVALWDSAGILANTVPRKGGIGLWWRIDPATGKVTQAPPTADPMWLPASIATKYHQFGYMGSDAAGNRMFRIGSREPGVQLTVLLVNGSNVTTIYSGRNGDGKDFDPSAASFDAHGIWFSNYDDKWVWLWSATPGLRQFPVTGLPSMPGGNVQYYPEGPCVPGTRPLPAGVDFSTLTSRPLVLPAVSPGAACPVTPQQNLDVINGKGKGGTRYGYGDWPAYVSGQIDWYTGSQGVLVLVSPEYTGPIIIRSQRLDGAGSLGMSGESTTMMLAGGVIGVPVTSSPPRWGEWDGVMVPTAPGCYGIQIDGNSWSSVAVIEVKKGPPPPG